MSLTELMGIKEFSESRNISDKMLRKLIKQGKVSAGRYGRKWLLAADVVDQQLREMFAPPAKQDKVQNIRKGRYQSALKALLD